jgi:hypothetical protein
MRDFAAFGDDPCEGAVCPLALPRAYFGKDEGRVA